MTGLLRGSTLLLFLLGRQWCRFFALIKISLSLSGAGFAGYKSPYYFLFSFFVNPCHPPMSFRVLGLLQWSSL